MHIKLLHSLKLKCCFKNVYKPTINKEYQLSLFVLVLTSTSTVAITAAPAPRKAKAYYTCDKGNSCKLQS